MLLAMDAPNNHEQEQLRSKQDFFTLLHRLSADEAADDGLDAREERRRHRHSRFFQRQQTPRPPPQSAQREVSDTKPSKNSGSETVQTPEPGASRHKVIKATQSAARGKTRVDILLDEDVEVIGETPLQNKTNESSRSSGSFLGGFKRRGLAESSTHSPLLPAATTKKRKKGDMVQLKPESEQVFKGLSFYYVPDDDIAPARRLRINKAREYGAAWTRSIGEATHVVVDKSIAYKDVEAMLRRIQASTVKVVNEDYPIDCIQFRAMLDSDQAKYRLSGQPNSNSTSTMKEIETATASSAEPVKSLKLKPPETNPNRWDYVPPQSTPDVSEPSGSATKEDSQPIVLDIEQNTDASPKATTYEDVTANNQGDELSDFISMMQEFRDLPLDKDDEDDTRSEVSYDVGGSGSDETEHEPSPEKKRVASSYRRARKPVLEQREKFACHRAGEKTAHDGNPNARTVEILQKMLDYYVRINDQWRIMAYRRAISQLKRQDEKISTEEDALQLPSIGPRLAKKIEEIVTTDKLQRLEYAQQDETDAVLQLFLGVYGVGTKLAQQWISQGYRTLEELKLHPKLTPSQRIGIERYEDLNVKIPRREVEALGKVVQKAAQQIDGTVELIIGGSYRRGAVSSSDIDFIVTKPGTIAAAELHSFLAKLVSKLEEDNFLVQRLASMRSSSGDGSLWHGCCVLPKIAGFNDDSYREVWRRVDFLLVPHSQMGGALIYFTGDDIFNRSLRLLARKKGMRLNQRGLYKRGLFGQSAVEDDLIEGKDEKRIFEILGVKWRPPEERWC